MGMTIDEARTALGKERKYALHENKQAFDIAIDTMKKYQMMQADYEQRLKSDMVAMLTEIQTEIEELDTPPAYQDEDYFLIGTNRCSELIQHKINTLKESRNDN
jgi:hypothetical protein